TGNREQGTGNREQVLRHGDRCYATGTGATPRGQVTEINYPLPITHYPLPSNLKTLDSRGQGYGA
ncbi:hypothetical protein PN451_00215, partial [Dolichospermum planctonicum CS-1226]